MLVAAKNLTVVKKVKESIDQRFEMKALGTVKHLLGMEIQYNREKKLMYTKQRKYIEETAELFKQAFARTTETPVDQSVKLSCTSCPTTDEEKATMTRTPYRQLIGTLLYVSTCTRPELAFVVSQLGRLMNNPGQQH